MRFKVRLTEGAERDIEEIYRYIAMRDSIGRADRVVASLDEACTTLSAFPGRGSVPRELRGLGMTGFREIHRGPYRVIYRIAGRQVFIDCVVDGRRDMQSLLQRRLLR